MVNSSIINKLLPTLLENDEAVEILDDHGVAPEKYIAFMIDEQLRQQQIIGKIMTVAFTLGFFVLGYFAGADNSPSIKVALIAGGGLGLLGFVLGYGATRMMAGARFKYIDHPDSQTANFTLLGVLATFKPVFMKKMKDQRWNDISAFTFSTSDARYQELPTRVMREEERRELKQMTPEKEEFVAKLKRVQRFSGWFVLVGLLAFVTEGLLFLALAWASGSLWFFFEGLIGFVSREISGDGDGGTTDVYGWPARLISIVIMFTAAMFFLSGLLGVFSELGYDLIELIF